MIRQELNPVTCKLDRKQINLRRSLRRYKWLIRPLIHRNAIASLDWIGKSAPVPLHYLRREKKEEKRKRRKFYIYPDVTHTHTRQSRGNPERQEEEKSGHTGLYRYHFNNSRAQLLHLSAGQNVHLLQCKTQCLQQRYC